MQNSFIILIGKLITLISKAFNLGSGSTWPGHIALIVNKNFIKETLHNTQTPIKSGQTKVVLVAGTNGKTTTSRMITTILKENHKTVFQNTAGANLLNGIASAVIMHSGFNGKIHKDYGIFEVDENILPLLLKELTPHAVILLNLFRDQLDRYGEIDNISKKWKTALQALPSSSVVILNADDPQIAFLGKDIPAKVINFGLEDKKLDQKVLEHASDSMYCPNCHTRLSYQAIYYSHLGIWHCPKCQLKRPRLNVSSAYYPLAGTYNKYNTLAAVALVQNEHLTDEQIIQALKTVTPAFGRQEVLDIENKRIQIFLSKNPASFNQSLETIANLGAKTLLIVLNDRIPDGRDVSWIWDIDFEKYMTRFEHIIVSGDRVYDMALRLEYAEKEFRISNFKFQIELILDEAIKTSSI